MKKGTLILFIIFLISNPAWSALYEFEMAQTLHQENNLDAQTGYFAANASVPLEESLSFIFQANLQDTIANSDAELLGANRSLGFGLSVKTMRKIDTTVFFSRHKDRSLYYLGDPVDFINIEQNLHLQNFDFSLAYLKRRNDVKGKLNGGIVAISYYPVRNILLNVERGMHDISDNYALNMIYQFNKSKIAIYFTASNIEQSFQYGIGMKLLFSKHQELRGMAQEKNLRNSILRREIMK